MRAASCLRWRRRNGAAAGAAIAIVPALIALAFAALAGAHGKHSPLPRDANVDADPALERIVPRNLCEARDGSLQALTDCPAGLRPRHRIEVDDNCKGRPYTFNLSAVGDILIQFQVVEADGRRASREVLFDMRNAQSGRYGEARLVRVLGGDPGNCPRRKTLFAYSGRRPLGPLPRRAVVPATWGIEVNDYSRRFAGKEIRLGETYSDRDDPSCCPSFLTYTYLRLSRAKDRYVSFRRDVGDLGG
jgi:hypothetical protein